MELEQKQHSSGVAKAGLTTGIIGSSLGALNLLGGLPFAMNRNFQNGVCNGDCENSRTVTKYELDQSQEISRLKSELALKDANIYGDQKMLELYRYIDGKFIEFEKQFLLLRQLQNRQIEIRLAWLTSALHVLRLNCAVRLIMNVTKGVALMIL